MREKPTLLCFLIFSSAVAPDLLAQAVVDTSLVVAPALQRPRVDGIIDDEAWRDAVSMAGFKTLRPAQGLQPSLHTEMLLAADRERLYVAFRCRDDEASLLRTQGEEEQDIFLDDWVLFALDTYGDGLSAYFFGVNPNGARTDGTLNWEGRPDVKLDLDWESAVGRSPQGYTVELAIPFAELSYPRSPDLVMAFKAARFVARLQEEVNFPEMRPDGGPPLTQFRPIAIPPLPPSAIRAGVMIPHPETPQTRADPADLDTLEGRVDAWGEVEVTDHVLFPREDVHNRGDAHRFPAHTRERFVSSAFERLEYRDGRPIGDLGSFLTRTATAAFIVILQDTVVYERYFNGYGRDSIMTSFSVAKSFASTLVGAAIDDGLIGSVKDPVTRYIPELAERDPRFSAITIEALLSMSSGLRYREAPPEWDDAVTYYHPRLREAALGNTSVEGPPGRRFHYNNYNPLLIGIVLERVTDGSVARYLEEKIWTPLGMEYPGSWSLDSEASRFAKMESGINARAIDFAKLGQLFLQRGRWKQKQVVSAEWIAAATRPIEHTVGYYPRSPFFQSEDGYYGYFWWGRRRGPGPHDFFARGNKGQFIYVSPQARLVVVRTGIEYGVPFDTWARLFYDFATRLATRPQPDESPGERQASGVTR